MARSNALHHAVTAILSSATNEKQKCKSQYKCLSNITLLEPPLSLFLTSLAYKKIEEFNYIEARARTNTAVSFRLPPAITYVQCSYTTNPTQSHPTHFLLIQQEMGKLFV